MDRTRPKLRRVLFSALIAVIIGLTVCAIFLLYTPAMPNRMQKTNMSKTNEDLQQRLTPEQFYVTQQKGTEAPFTGEYWNHHAGGMYRCVVCGAELFTSESKFDSGCGWPSFDRAATEANVGTQLDQTHGMTRDEIVCTKCGAHLGHVFNDGPTDTGLRYCVNSASLKFDADKSK